MTELLDSGEGEVRAGPDGGPAAVRTGGGWREVTRTVNRWVVETDWWRAPVRREYRRCLVAGGDCLELCRELDSPRWSVVRRYD
ncbi:MAG: hypothetical protein E6I76_10060 [Chloroflexi bacterium]|nr:MAG: hypothetical protein E6J03_10135 [Chloroflexota bacterium]TMD95545.1 MAG: hypothetical protein E6I76_10060 [Chloroflexota bacterium]